MIQAPSTTYFPYTALRVIIVKPDTKVDLSYFRGSFYTSITKGTVCVVIVESSAKTAFKRNTATGRTILDINKATGGKLKTLIILKAVTIGHVHRAPVFGGLYISLTLGPNTVRVHYR